MDDLATAQYEKAAKLAEERNFQESIKLCRLILLGQPKYVECRLLLAKSLLALARYEEVLAETQILLDLVPDNAEVYSLKGEALFFKGEFMAAHVALTKAAKLDPENKKVQRLLADIEPSMDTGGAFLDGEDDPAATRSYPLAEQATDVDPTEMMESPPVMEPWDEEDEEPPPTAAVALPPTDAEVVEEGESETLPEGPSASSPQEAETQAGHRVAPALLAASRRPDESASRDAETRPIDMGPHRAGLLKDVGAGGSFLPSDEEGAGDGGGEDAVTRAEVPGSVRKRKAAGSGVRAPFGSRLKARPAVVEGVESETPLEEGPRGAVVKFLPSDQLVTVEQVAITTGEIKDEEVESSFDLGEIESHESPASEAGTVSLKVTPQPKNQEGRRPRPSVEIGDALVPKPRRLRPLARHRGRLPSPDGAALEADLDEVEDAPTTPHLDISNVGAAPEPKPPATPRPLGSEARQPLRRSGSALEGADLDLGLAPEAPARPKRPPARPPMPPLRPSGAGALSPGAGVAPPVPGGSGGARPAPPRKPAAAAGPSGGSQPVLPAGPPVPGSGRARPSVGAGSGQSPGPVRPVSPARSSAVQQAPGRTRTRTPASAPTRGPAAASAPTSGSGVRGSRLDKGSRPKAPSTGRSVVGRKPAASTGMSSRPRERGPGTSLTAMPRRKRAAWWRRRGVRIGVAVGGVVVLAALAGWFYVRWVRRGQASKKRTRALTLMARVDPEGLLAAQFLFARIQKLGVDSNDAAAGRAIVNLLSCMEYGDEPRVAAQILRGMPSHASGPLVVAAKSGLLLVRGDASRALALASRGVQKYPKSSWAFYFRAAAQDALGDFDGAVGGGRRSLSLKPGTGIAGKLLLARIWRDEGLTFDRPTAVDRARETLEQARSEPGNKDHPALLLAVAQTRLAKCQLHQGCPCEDLNPLVEDLEKLQIRMQGHSTASVSVPRVRLIRAAVLSCLRRDSAGEMIPTIPQGNAGRPDLDAIYASLLIEHHRVDRAMAFLERAVERYPGWTRFHLMLARAALAKKDPKRADKVLAGVPRAARSASWYALSVRVFLARGKLDKALALAKQAVREYSDRVDVRLAQVQALLAAGKTARAGKIAEDLFRHHPNDTRVLTTSAGILAQRGEYLRAKARLDAALSRDRNNATVLLHLGRVLMGLGKIEEAKQHLKRAVAIQPDLSAGWLALGKLEEMQGRFESAADHYRKLLKKHPGHPDGIYALAGVLIHRGRLSEAANLLKKIPESSRKGRWHLLHGWLLLREGEDLPKAERELKSACRSGLRGRDLAIAFVRHAQAFLLLDQPSRAEEVLDSLDGRQRSLPEVRETWGRLWLWRGKPKKALRWFKRALRSCGAGCPLWRRGRLFAYLGRAYYLKGSTRLAWAKFRKAFRLAGTDPMVLFLYGACLYEDSREDASRRRFEAAVARDPAQMEAYYYLGELARSAGEKAKAASLFRRFLRARRFGALADQARSSLRDVTR